MNSPVTEIRVRKPQHADIDELRPIMERWIRDPLTDDVIDSEVSLIEKSVELSIEGRNNQEYLVAEREDKIVGIMGIQAPDITMLPYTLSNRCAELVTALVSDEVRGQGVGKLLVAALTHKAALDGKDEVIVNSGPRFRETGWPFWRKLYGEPSAVALDYYGEGADAMIWRKNINPLEMKETDPAIIATQISEGLKAENDRYFGFMNNLEAKFPGGHLRELIIKHGWQNDLIVDPEKAHDETLPLHSDKATSTTYTEFFNDIELALDAAGIDRDRLAHIRADQYNPLEHDRGAAQEAYCEAILPVYRELRINGYSHYDLWV